MADLTSACSRLRPIEATAAEVEPLVLEHGRMTVRQAAALTGANRNTVKDHLKRLVNSGLLTRRGRGRGTWYEKV